MAKTLLGIAALIAAAGCGNAPLSSSVNPQDLAWDICLNDWGVTASDINNLFWAAETDRNNGFSFDQEMNIVGESCYGFVDYPQEINDACYACNTAIVEAVYGG